MPSHITISFFHWSCVDKEIESNYFMTQWVIKGKKKQLKESTCIWSHQLRALDQVWIARVINSGPMNDHIINSGYGVVFFCNFIVLMNAAVQWKEEEIKTRLMKDCWLFSCCSGKIISRLVRFISHLLEL